MAHPAHLRPVPPPDASPAAASDARTAVLDARQLTVRFADGQGRPVAPLSAFDLAIAPRSITCILGPSGSGKTTLLRALGGFVVGEPTGGVLFEGRYLTGPTREIVMIFQENNLYPWLTVRQNIDFGLRYVEGGRREKADRREAMIETVGLKDAADRYPHQLSGGMRQRTAIARALVTQPRVLLLDEPFSALDVTLRRRMNQLLADIASRLDTTMVMVTHNVEEAITLGHRVVVMGGQPATVRLDADTSDPAFSDRYGRPFLDLQRSIEDLIE